MRPIIEKILSVLLMPFPPHFFAKGVSLLVRSRMATADPEPRMRALLFQLNNLNNELANAGVALGDGSHVKHRLMKYHDFFVQNISSGQTVLDVGCGFGEVAASIAKRSNAKVICVDIDAEKIALAKHNYANLDIDFIHGDATTLSLSNKTDVLVLSNVLEHIKDRVSFLKSLFEQTKAPVALIRVPIYERDWTVPMREELGIEWRLDTTHFTEYRIPQFEEEISQAGGKIISMEVRWCEIWAVIERSQSEPKK